MAAHFIASLGIFLSFSQLSLLFLTLDPKGSRSIWSSLIFFSTWNSTFSPLFPIHQRWLCLLFFLK